MSETYKEEHEINEAEFRLAKDEYTQEDRDQEILADHEDENPPAEDNDPIQD